MSEPTLDRSQSGLLAVIQMLLSAQELEDVRGAVAHGAKLVCRFDTLSLYEVTPSGRLDRTIRRGNELAPGATAVEDMLSGRVAKTSRTASTLDRFVDVHEQSLADGYVNRHGLCLARPLQVYGEFVGVLVFHFESRPALPDTEFDSLRRFVEFAAVALSNARTRAELRGFAYSDPLTGLANRRRLEVEFARLQGTPLSLLLADFDGLKAVNDSLGYHRGDDLIKAVATKLGVGAAMGEFVVRYGGDEFVIVLPKIGREQAVRRAEELTTRLDRLTLPEDLAALFHGASVGYATASAGDDLWEVLDRASVEMRSRKRRRKTDRELLGEDSELHFGA
jgi:diguanylate cyclase (GGDEF)-like protein